MRSVVKIFAGYLVIGIAVSSVALGWGPGIHQELAARFYEAPLIAGFAAEFGTDVSAVVSGADDLDFASSDHKSKYHDGQWTMVVNREYVRYAASPSDWYDLDETTRLKYMMHNLGDVSVPIGHSPANSVPGAESGQVKEAFFEAQADVGSYGSPAFYSGSGYTGTVSQCVSQYYNEHMSNVYYFRDNVSTGFLTVTPWANANASAHTGWALAQKLARVILTDYYLSRRPAATGAATDITVGPGQTAVFDASNLRDPDNVVWASNGTYSYDAGWTGITQIRWDLDGDGVYETTGLTLSRTYAQLAALIGPNASRMFGIEVTDDEGNVTYDSALLTTVPEPAGLLWLTFGSALLNRRRKKKNPGF